DKVAEVLARPEVRVNFQKVLNAISVIGGLERNLFEDGTDPDRCHSQSAQVSQLGSQAFQGSALPACRLAQPLPIWHGTDIIACRKRSASGSYKLTIVVAVTALLVAIREAVQHQKVENLVGPTIRRRRVQAAGQVGEVDIGDTPHAPNFSSRNACASSNPMRYFDSRVPSPPLAHTLSVNAADPSLLQVGDTR